MSLVIVIGRGHSGTRAIAQTLIASGIHMGDELNNSADFMGTGDGAGEMYRAARMFPRAVEQVSPYRWKFDYPLSVSDVPHDFQERVLRYAEPILKRVRDGETAGWKLPETTLCYPWIARMFPEARFLWVVRDPRDVLLKPHGTDDLRQWQVPAEGVNGEMVRRVQSWIYQNQLVEESPIPRFFMKVRLCDLVHNQGRTLERMSSLVGVKLEKIQVYPTPVGRWRREGHREIWHETVREALGRHGYDW